MPILTGICIKKLPTNAHGSLLSPQLLRLRLTPRTVFIFPRIGLIIMGFPCSGLECIQIYNHLTTLMFVSRIEAHLAPRHSAHKQEGTTSPTTGPSTIIVLIHIPTHSHSLPSAVRTTSHSTNNKCRTPMQLTYNPDGHSA